MEEDLPGPVHRDYFRREKRPQEELWEEFRGEISGVLNWALEGWRDFRENGLAVPEAVKNATLEYKSESDTLEAFINTTKLF